MINTRDRLRHLSEEVDSEGSWAISYGDMITLLLTFFILFFSVDKAKTSTKAIQDAVLSALQPLKTPSTEAFEETKLSLGQRKGINIDEAFLKEAGAQISKAGSRVVIEFPNLSFFQFGKIEVRGEAVAVLENFAKTYLPYAGGSVLSIRAYTDHRPVFASRDKPFRDNLELSALRSVAAMRALQNAGIPLTRMRIGGYGPLNFDPIDPNSPNIRQETTGDPGVALARKVVLIIEPEVKERL